MLTTFEGQIRHFVKECVIISHYHHGVSYQEVLELTPFEKEIMSEFISEEIERENKTRATMFGLKK